GGLLEGHEAWLGRIVRIPHAELDTGLGRAGLEYDDRVVQLGLRPVRHQELDQPAGTEVGEDFPGDSLLMATGLLKRDALVVLVHPGPERAAEPFLDRALFGVRELAQVRVAGNDDA